MKIGFFGMLGLILITLKFTGYITASWWLLFVPVWVPVLVALLVVGVLAWGEV